MFGTAAPDAKLADAKLVAYHAEDKRVLRYELGPRVPDQQSAPGRTTMLAPHVRGDGTIAFLAAVEEQSRPAALGLFTLASNGDITRSRRVDAPQFFGQLVLGLRDERVFLWSAAVGQISVSMNGGAAFRGYAPDSFVGLGYFQNPDMLCGSAGCDFRWLKDGWYLAWRWGSGPLEQTLTGPLSHLTP